MPFGDEFWSRLKKLQHSPSPTLAPVTDVFVRELELGGMGEADGSDGVLDVGGDACAV